MHFFTYELIARSNGWRDESPSAIRAASAELERVVARYRRHLDRIRGRVPGPAWRFFRHAVMDRSLHDARLLDLRIGDAMPGARHTARDFINRSVTRVSVEFRAHDETWIGSFACSGVRDVRVALGAATPLRRNLGDLYAYELRAVDREFLTLGFLFASGGTIEVECKRLSFRVRDVVQTPRRHGNRRA